MELDIRNKDFKNIKQKAIQSCEKTKESTGSFITKKTNKVYRSAASNAVAAKTFKWMLHEYFESRKGPNKKSFSEFLNTDLPYSLEEQTVLKTEAYKEKVQNAKKKALSPFSKFKTFFGNLKNKFKKEPKMLPPPENEKDVITVEGKFLDDLKHKTQDLKDTPVAETKSNEINIEKNNDELER